MDINKNNEEKPNDTSFSGSSDEDCEKSVYIDCAGSSSSENNTCQTSKTNMRKKERNTDVRAPKQPLTGYLHFLRDRRKTVRSKQPFAEISRQLGNEWTNLPADQKQPYLDRAVRDKERYTKEYNAYKVTQAYNYMKQVSEKENKDTGVSVASTSKESNTNEIDMDIPLFTDEFLAHTKMRDAKLMQLKKSNMDYEKKNASLQKQIQDIKEALIKLEAEILQQRKNNKSLEEHLNELRRDITIPTLPTIYTCMGSLHAMLLENSSQDAHFLQMVRDIVAQLEFNG